MELLPSCRKDTTTGHNYRMVQIPRTLYQNWREIAWNITDLQVARMVILRLLRAWIWAKHPLDKLCAFEDFGKEEAGRLGWEPGMYVILRRMTPAELILSQQAKEGQIPESEDPQWILEYDSITIIPKPELNEHYQTDSIDSPQQSGQPRLQGEL